MTAPSESRVDEAPDLAELAVALEGETPERILTVAAERWAGSIVLTTGFGAEGCVLVDVVGRLGLPIRVVTLDTGYLFPESLDLWRLLEERYGLAIEPVRPSPVADEADALNGGPLHRTAPDRCCFLRKVEPLQRFLEGQAAWVTAIRRDQSADRRQALVVERDPRFGLVKVNPLVAWSGADVASYVSQHDVPTNSLHERGYRSIGCAPCTSPVAPGEDERAGRWRGREKTECGLHGRRPAPQEEVS